MSFQKSRPKKSFFIADILGLNEKVVENKTIETSNYIYHQTPIRCEDDYSNLNDSFTHSNDSSDRHRSRSRSDTRSRSRSRSSSGSSCNLKKNRKSRTAFSDYQLNSLEKSFEKHKYLNVQDRIELANRLHLTDTQVKTWYQNRRTKWKRQSSLGLEWILAAAALEQQQSSALQNQQFVSNNNNNTQNFDVKSFPQYNYLPQFLGHIPNEQTSPKNLNCFSNALSHIKESRFNQEQTEAEPVYC